MVTGWKDIIKHTGFSIGTIKKLHRKENFPLLWIANRPVISEAAVEKWLSSFEEKQKAKSLKK